ncbi:MAG TPA: hypothetical protein VMF51_15420 [Nocardioides sp.]|uniref:hypothetical protein n=1 Tax=Nocardioides sp. TaxID=35761 RepID=UPI002CF0864C|nr:hypothetical protein [Nocardioides sp.]HTW16526.1 hypothetical protein [Nocardioides sp.]
MTRTPKLIASAFLVLTLATACGGGDDGDDKSAEGTSTGGATEATTEPTAESTNQASENRPSVDEISAYFVNGENALGEVKEEQADCIAEAFHGSDVSDEWLQALVANDAEYVANDADQKTVDAISVDWMKECMGVEAPPS